MTSQISEMTSSTWRFFVSVVKFSYWSKFHVNIVSGSGIMTIFFYKGLTRNPEVGNTPVWVLPNIWRLWLVVVTKSGTNVSNRMLWMLQNARVTAFTAFELLRENQLGGGDKINPPLRVNNYKNIYKQLYLWLSRRLKLNFYAGFFQRSGVVI